MIHFKMYHSNEWKDITNEEYEQYSKGNSRLFWMDFQTPTNEELIKVLEPFSLHPASISECLDDVQRPKVEFFNDYTYIIAHALNENIEAIEINIFILKNMVITVHKKHCKDVAEAWRSIGKGKRKENTNHLLAQYILDSIVDNYFEKLYTLQDKVNTFTDEVPDSKELNVLFTEIFDIRKDIHHMRKSTHPMRDLLYRMSESLAIKEMEKRYYRIVYHHLQRVCESIEELQSNSNDVRDNLLSMRSYETNQIMKTLTVITTIFMPLTVIVGIYGMNFYYMPELKWRYSYPVVMIIMVLLVIVMGVWFKKKKWF